MVDITYRWELLNYIVTKFHNADMCSAVPDKCESHLTLISVLKEFLSPLLMLQAVGD